MRRKWQNFKPVRETQFGWFWLVQVAAVSETGLLFASGVYLRDAEALALAFVVLLTLGWIFFRPGRIVPVVVRSLVFADVAFWMVPAAFSNAISHSSLGSILLPGILGTTAIVGLLAAAGFLISRGNQAAGSRAARGVAALALAVILVVAGFAAATASTTTVSGNAVAISAKTGDGLPALLEALSSALRPVRDFVDLSVPHHEAAAIARLASRPKARRSWPGLWAWQDVHPRPEGSGGPHLG